MELNKYDLMDWLVSNFRNISCGDCPIQKECDEGRGECYYLCSDEDKTRETLIKKYNL